MNQEARDKLYCRNFWQFEGVILKPPCEVPTRTGLLRVAVHLRDREPVRGEKKYPTMVKALSYGEHAKTVLTYKEGDRLLVSGNFHNPPRTAPDPHRTRYVITASRIALEGTTSLNHWEFEGRIAIKPFLKLMSGVNWGHLNAWQTSVTTKDGSRPMRTQPVLLNTLVRPGRLSREIKTLYRGDDVWMTGRLCTLRRRSEACWPLCERVTLTDRETADRRMLLKTTGLLAPDLDVFEI